jgi:molecular chaperone DnaJ
MKTKVTMPAGVEHGIQLRFNVFGEAGIRGGRNGGRWAVVSMKSGKQLERDGDHWP